MTRRLILWLTGMTVLLWLVAAGLGALLMREEFDEVFDSALSETAQRLLPLAVEDILDREPGAGSYRLPASPGAGDDEYLTFQVRDASGAVLLYSYGAPAEPFAAPLVPGYHDTPTHRVFTTSAVDGTILLQVADPLAHRRESTVEGLVALMLPLIALIPLSVVAVGLVVRRALKPIGRLSSEIEARSGANLTTLQTGALPPELSVIAASVNGLLDRLRRAMEAERSFTTNSAHELRTPLAGALAQTQRLIEELEPRTSDRRGDSSADRPVGEASAACPGGGRHRDLGTSGCSRTRRAHGRGGNRENASGGRIGRGDRRGATARPCGRR